MARPRLAMSAGRSVSAGCATMRAGCATGFARAGCRPARASCRSRSRRSVRRRRRSRRSCSRRTPKLLRTEPLKALVIGAFVRGLSMRDVESLCEEAGLGKLSKSTASRMCEELQRALRGVQAPRALRDPAGRAVPRRDVHRRSARAARRRACLVAWGFTEQGERVLLSVMLGDARVLRGLAGPRPRPDRRGLAAPMLVVADGAPGLIEGDRAAAGPRSDRQRCAVHRAAKPLRQAARTQNASGSSTPTGKRSTDAINEQGRQTATPGACRRARQGRLRPPRRSASPTTSTRSSCTCATRSGTAERWRVNEPARALARRSQTAHEGDGPLPRRGPAA